MRCRLAILVLVCGVFLLPAHAGNAATPGMRPVVLPGAPPFSQALQHKLRRAVAGQGKEYVPRTRHLDPDGSPKYVNRLIFEDSPYLLQHAHNPVNWYPWGDEAFARARAENKPVLLSVGYSTCHWCHVMEVESFENEEIARYLNEHYIAIKVDREQRPDVDGVYMAAVQMMTGSGGWPMTVWLNPQRQPFYGGTYFPPQDGVRGSRIGFLTLLRKLDQVYREKPDDAARAASNIVARIQARLVAASGTALPKAEVLAAAARTLAGRFDHEHGGFGRAPKFPRPVTLEFLLRYQRRSGDETARRMVEDTLTAMAAGGVYDQIGGGFHRYSTDARWLVPHFEKMLYDNALLVEAYLDGYQVTENPDFARVARETLAYVEREMTAPGGGFFSASDADSEGEEGKFFVWTPAQLAAALDAEQARVLSAYYGVTAHGNFEGASILHVTRPLAEVAAELKIDTARAAEVLRAGRKRLYAARRKRVPPHTDRKILPAWNGLMISAFARAAQVLGEEHDARVAARAAEFILTRLVHGERLRRSAFGGAVTGEGYLDDYAFMIAGLLDLYEADFNPRWLRRALRLQAVLDDHFQDSVSGGYFLTGDEHEVLIAREKPSYDGAVPSGNSVAVLNVLRLYEFTTDGRYRKQAERALRAFELVMASNPTSVPGLLTALDFFLDRVKEIVIVLPPSGDGAGAFLERLRATFLPARIVAVVREGSAQDELARTVPLVSGKVARRGKATAYVCERQVCALPTSDVETFARQIAGRNAGS